MRKWFLTSCLIFSPLIGYASGIYNPGTGGGGGGSGASSLAVTTGSVSGFTSVTSSPTAVIVFDSNTTNGKLTGSSTYFFTLNPSSVTLQGPVVSSITLASMYGAPTLTGTNITGLVGANITGIVPSGVLPSTVVYTTQSSSVTINSNFGVTGQVNLPMTHTSSVTIQGNFGVQGQVNQSLTIASSVTVTGSNAVQVSSNVILPGTTFYQSGNVVLGYSGSSVNAPFLTPSRCIQTDSNGNVTSAGAACGSGGGGSFSLVVTTGGPTSYIGVPISSFNTTTTLLFDSATTKGSLLASNTYFYQIRSDSVTLQANTFNGANQLVQTNGSTQLPAISGALLTNLTGANIVSGIASTVLPSSVAYLSSTQTFTAPQTFTDSVTISSSMIVNGGGVGQLIILSPGNVNQLIASTNNVTISSFVATGSAAIPTYSQNMGVSTLNQWFSQMASIQNPALPLKNNKLSIFMLGDSHLAKNVETGPFITWLYDNFGNAGEYMPASDNSEFDNTTRPNGCTYSRDANWKINPLLSTSLGLDDDQMHSSTPTATILMTCPNSDQVTLHYVNQAGGGTITFKVDGANTMTLNTNFALAVASATVTGLPYGVHTASITIFSTGTVGTDVLDTVFFSSSTPGAVIYRAGTNAIRADHYTAQDATKYQNLVQMLPSTPSVVMIALDVNDASTNISTTAFISNMRNLFQRFRNVYPRIDCVYMSEPDFLASGADTYQMAAYENAMLQASVADQCAFVDFTALFSSYSLFSQYYSDTIHLNTQGGQVGSQILINTFSNAAYNTSAFTVNIASQVVAYGNDQSTNMISGISAFGSNIKISSGINNSGAIGTNLTIASSNTFLIGGALGSGNEQNLIVSTENVNSLNVNYGLSVTSETGAGLTTCGDATHALSYLGSPTNTFGCQAITGSGGSTALSYPGFLQAGHYLKTYGVSGTSYTMTGVSAFTSLDTETTAQITYHTAGTFNGFWVQVKSNGLTSPATFYLRINGNNGAESIVVPSGAIGEFQDTGHVDRINAGDKVDYMIQTGAGGTTLGLLSIASIFRPVNNNLVRYVSIGDTLKNDNSGVTTYYDPIAGLIAFSNQTESSSSYKIKTSGTFQNFGLYVSTNSRSGTTTFNFRKNGANGNETISVPAGTSGLFEDTTHTDTVVIGDTVDYATVGDGNANNNQLRVAWMGTEFMTTNSSMEYVAANPSDHQFNPSETNYWPLEGYCGTDSQETADMQVMSQVGMICSNMHVHVDSNSMSVPVTLTFRKNHSNGNQTITIPAGGWGYFEDTYSSHTDVISQGDELDWLETTAAGVGNAPFNYIGMTCSYAPANAVGGSNQQVLFNDSSTENGSSLFTFNKSSGAVAVTYNVTAGTFTSTGLGSIFTNGAYGSDNDTVGVLDVFKQGANAGDVIFSVGSNQQVNQVVMKDRNYLNLSNYGVKAGHLYVGDDQAQNPTHTINDDNSATQLINVWNGGEMDLQTTTSGNGGTDVVVKPQTAEDARFSNTAGIILTSSVTVTGSAIFQSSVTISSNTVMPGTTIYQNGNANFSQSITQAAISAPAALVSGQQWNDSSQKSRMLYEAGVTQAAEGTLWTMTTSSSDQNNSTEVTLATGTLGTGTLTLPPNFFTVGKTLFMVLSGTYTTTATPTLDLKVKLKGTALLDSTAITQAAVTGTDVFTLNVAITCRTTGASGTIMATGQTVQNTSTIATAGMDLNSTLTTIDTTVQQTLTVSATWGAASASNNLTFTNGFVTVKN